MEALEADGHVISQHATYGSLVVASSIRRIQVFPDRGTVANTIRLRTWGKPSTHLQPTQFNGILQGRKADGYAENMTCKG